VIKSRSFAKGQKFFVVMVIFVCCLLFFANAIAFNPISASIFVNEIIAYLALTVAVTLTIITLASVIRDKRRSLSPKTQKPNVVNSSKETIVTPSMILSPVDSQENKDKGYLNPSGVQTANKSDRSTVTSMAKSSRKRSLVAILIAIIVGLLLYVNVVAFNLIVLPEYTIYVALAVVAALIITTMAIALVDKPKSAMLKTPIVDVVGAIQESNALSELPDTVSLPTIAQTSVEKVESNIGAIETSKVPDEKSTSIARIGKVFGKRSLFVIIVALTVGLLLFANAVAFGLISLHEYSMYAAVAGAVAIAAIVVTIILIEKIKILGEKIKKFVSEPQIREIINEVKEPYQAPDTAPAPVIAQTNTKKVDSYAELLRQFSVQKTINKLEVDKAEQEKQLPKKPVIPPTKVICPACRKEFSLPIYEKDLIVDFGSPKQSNTIKECPHCRTPMRLKRKGTVEEDIWKE
jgi:prepilin signal peptidase PulO-like enzyme (type II secretory pathway)